MNRRFPAAHPLPDWRNFGVMLRLLLGANLLALLAALVQGNTLTDGLARYVAMAALVEPLLLCSLALLALGRDLLWRLPLRWGQALVLAGVAGVSVALMLGFAPLLGSPPEALPRAVLLSVVGAGGLLLYFEWRARAFFPAQAEARLAALNARIRPHFLFNSLNAVLSLVRTRPQEAEAALEALSDLFRAALRDPGELVSLADEIDLGRQYLALEQLRLGERLAVDWQIGAIALGLPIPPLLLQPLLENAVYHGIEPAAAGGTVRVCIERRGDELLLSIANPLPGAATPPGRTTGRHMALDNIRERLALYYDLEARLEMHRDATTCEVRIILPCHPLPRSAS